ncbi:cytochrome-c peroxidase [Amylibacter ulvae]|uniref:Cytochrome-c peroxidase n=1 Tax=Paramylibacter ulvae TaxID=1651968 RepID=A0ABQ3CWU0_9RHOB|nr:cytochrome c peroxidase [Amylibacter ulvae]GHA40790.1 cytochrome-c peroxidase [Amylibacter ulvae]
MKILLLILGLVTFGLVLFADTSDQLVQLKKQYHRPFYIPFPRDKQFSPQIATLGKMLFFDPRLSGGQNISCVSCHNPSFGWETPVKTAIGGANVPLDRHAPTLLNMAWVTPLFWDGRAATLEDQVIGPITSPMEMNAKFDQVVARLEKVSEYRKWFNTLYPDQGITAQSIQDALGVYERTIVAGWSDFDRWIDGDDDAISDDAIAGFVLFNGKAGCATCHTGWNFTDNQFHNIGLPDDDIGRAAITQNFADDNHAFKTPGLRNIMLRAPYMHSGEMMDLNAVITHYAQGGFSDRFLGSAISPFEINEHEINQLIAFMKTLSETKIDVPTPVLPAN